MAQENDGASKTEEATPRKLQQAREKGDVAKSQDVAPFAALAAAVGVLAMAGGPLTMMMAETLTSFVREAGTTELGGDGAGATMRTAVLVSLPILGAVMLAAAIGGRVHPPGAEARARMIGWLIRRRAAKSLNFGEMA